MAVRVLHYVGIMNRGGMETFIMNLYRNIDRNKIQFDFAVHGDRAGDFEKEISALGGKFYYFPHMRKDPLKYRKAWKAFWKNNKERYVAFHMHTNSLANIIALEEAAKAGIPIRIVHSHSSMANKGRLQWLNDILHKWHQNRLPKLATHLFACSDRAAEWLFGRTEIKGLNVTKINNGVQISDFRYDPEIGKKLRTELNISDKKVIGHIGTFLPVKNHTFLIETIEKCYFSDPSVRCLLVGNGSRFNEIKDIVKQKHLQDVILFLGVRDDVNKLLSAMDLFIMPSLYEGLPVSLVEVQANGLPALVSDTITKDVAMQNNLHYMSLEASADEWARAALSIIENNERSFDTSCISENGFDIKKTVDLYESIILSKGNLANDRNQN